MRFEELNWMDVEGYLKQDDRVIVILGACEQHSYLSLLTDVRIPQALADAASQKTGVLVAPPVNFGCSPYFLSYPGTISVRVETLTAILEDVISSLYNVGFRRVLLLNGHGGNTAAKTKMFELCNAYSGLRFHWYEWWTANRVISVYERHNLKGTHANWMENFPFTRVAEVPAEAKTPVETELLGDSALTREQDGDGSLGGLYVADPKVMDEIFATALEDIVDYLNFGD